MPIKITDSRTVNIIAVLEFVAAIIREKSNSKRGENIFTFFQKNNSKEMGYKK